MKLTFLVYSFFILVFAYTIFSGVKTSATFAPDFSIFYHSAHDIIRHISPYTDKTLFTALNYPLASAVVFVPLTTFSFQIAQTIFTFLNILSVFGIVFISFLLLKKGVSPPVFLLTVSLVFLSFPTKFTLGMGQTNLLAYLLLLVSFLLLYHKKIAWTILFFIISILLKPILAIALLILLFEKQWKVFSLTLACIVICITSIPFLFNQPYANGIFLHNILSQTVEGREVYYNQGLLGFLSRLTTSLPLRSALHIFLSSQLMILTFWKILRASTIGKLSLLLTLLIIVDPLSWQHHFVWLILPFLTVFFAIQKSKKKVLLYTLLATCYLLLSVNVKNPLVLNHLPLSLLLSHQFYGVLLLFLLELFLL